MKSMNKKLSLLVTSVVLTSSLLAGCASKTSNPSSANGDTKTLSPYVLDWYFIGNGPQPDNEKVEKEADKLLTDINVQLKIHCFDWGSYPQKMQTLLATNDKVDLLMTAGGWGSLYFENVRKNALVDITDLAPKYAPHAVEILKGGFWEYSRAEGKNYALPVNKEKAAQMGFDFKKDLVDKYQFDISKVNSLDDLEPMLKTLKEKEPDIYPIEANTAIPAFLTMDDDSLAGGLVNLPHNSTDNTYVATVDNPNYIKIVNTMRKYYQAGYIKKDAATVKDVTPDRKAGKNFVLFDSLKPGKDEEVSLATGVKYVQKTIGTPIIRTSDSNGCMMGIAKAAKDPARVLMFMDKMYTDEKLINLIDYGIEGVHYVKKGANTIDFAPETDNGKKSGYNPGTPWMFGNQFKSYIFASEDPNKWQKFEEFNKAAKPLVSAGFTFNDESVKNEVAACTNVDKEFSFALNTGSVDPDTTLPKYREKLKAAGLDKIVAEVNKQYKDWKSKQSK